LKRRFLKALFDAKQRKIRNEYFRKMKKEQGYSQLKCPEKESRERIKKGLLSFFERDPLKEKVLSNTSSSGRE